MFLRENPYWDETEAKWGPTIGPWMVLAIIALATLGWYGFGRVVHKEWNWKIKRASRIDLDSGRAPILEVRNEERRKLFQRTGKRILEAI